MTARDADGARPGRRGATQRRHLLAASLALGGLALRPAVGQGGIRLRILSCWPRADDPRARSAARLADRIRDLGEGILAVDLVQAGSARAAAAALDTVAAGAAEAYHGPEDLWAARHPAHAVFGAVPFGLTAEEHAVWLTERGGLGLWRELSARSGVRPLAAGSAGAALGVLVPNSLRTLRDLAGLRLPMSGIAATVWHAAGGVAVALREQGPDDALAAGGIDGLAPGGPADALAAADAPGLARRVPVFHTPGWQAPSTPLALGLNAAFHDALPNAIRVLIEMAAEDEAGAIRAEARALNAEAFGRLVSRAELRISPLAPAILDRLALETRAALEAIAGHDALARRIVDSFRAVMAAQGPMSERLRGDYVAMRNAALGL